MAIVLAPPRPTATRLPTGGAKLATAVQVPPQKIEGGQVHVDFRRFRIGVTEKVEIG